MKRTEHIPRRSMSRSSPATFCLLVWIRAVVITNLEGTMYKVACTLCAICWTTIICHGAISTRNSKIKIWNLRISYEKGLTSNIPKRSSESFLKISETCTKKFSLYNLKKNLHMSNSSTPSKPKFKKTSSSTATCNPSPMSSSGRKT